MKRNWKYFSSLNIGDKFHFDYFLNSTIWIKNSNRTVKNLDNNRIFYASPQDIIWVFS